MKEYRAELEAFCPLVKLQLPEIAVDAPLRPKQIVTRIMILSTAALSHLRRGRVDESDPLNPYLKKWLMEYFTQLTQLSQSLLENAVS